MMMKFGLAGVPLLIFESLLKSLTPKSTKIPLRLSLICPFRNLSVLLFQVARAELCKAIQALIYLACLFHFLPSSGLGRKEPATLCRKLVISPHSLPILVNVEFSLFLIISLAPHYHHSDENRLTHGKRMVRIIPELYLCERKWSWNTNHNI